MPIIVKKKIFLGFLGDEYKDAYIIVKSIPLKDYDKIIDDSKKISEDEKKALKYVQELVTSRFIEGKFPDEQNNIQDITKEDLTEFPAEVFTEVMQQLSGKTPENLEKP